MNINTLLIEKKSLLLDTINSTLEVNSKQLLLLSKKFNDCLENGGTIYWCGNGGSAAEASHLSTELIGRFKSNRKSLASISLNSDNVAITCIANDFGYEKIFSRQIEGLGQEKDILIILSTSGESENVLEAIRQAKKMGIFTIGLLGKSGGRAVDLVDLSILVQSFETARIQEVHLLIGHTLCEFAEIELGLNL